MALIIKNATIVNAGEVVTGDIVINNGVFVQVGVSAQVAPDDQVMDATGLHVFPGLVDMHVHLRDPGQTHKEDILSGCAAACAGGVTSLVCMPNTVPSVDSPETVKYIIDRAKETGIHVYPAAAITYGLSGKGCCDYEALKKEGAAALSDDGRPVESDEMLLCALQEGKRLGLPVRQAAGGKVHEGRASRMLGVKGMSSSSEYGDIDRTIRLAESIGAPVHICHVSTKESIEIIRQAKARGVKVTCETAPHSPEEKADFVKAPNGVVGMETSLAATLTYMGDKLSLSDIARLMSTNPAGIMGIPAGEVKAGAPADFVLVDLHEKWTVDPDRLHGRSKNAVFKGETLTGRVKATFCGGKNVF